MKIKKYRQEQAKKDCTHMEELFWDFGQNWKPNYNSLYPRLKEDVDSKSN
jgi:hypothetical protein